VFRAAFIGSIFATKHGLLLSADFQLLRKEMGEERAHRRRRRRAYSVFEEVDDISTTAWTPSR
jgi:hypothetical protein